MTPGTADVRPPAVSPEARLWCVVAAGVLTVLALVPPLSGLAHRYETAEALRFSVFAIVVPALVVLGAPWWRLGLAARPGSPADGGAPTGPVDRLARGRRRHPELIRAFGFVALDVAVMTLWRTPVGVDNVVRHGWLVVPELVTLVAAGVGLWLECIESPPLVPRSTRPLRAAIAAVAMWSVWIMAYLVALSRSNWYATFHHVAGHGLSAPADQQFATVVLWFVAAAAFVPVVFWNLTRWLRTEEDPDDELHRLVKEERRRGWASPPARLGPKPGSVG